MKSRLSHLFRFLALMLPVVLLVMFIPIDRALGDANVPTETNTPLPTDTLTPQPTEIPPTDLPPATDTPIVFATDNSLGQPDTGITLTTPITPPPSGGLSTINRILLMILAVAVVIVIGVIVYLVYYQTRGANSLEER